MITPLQNNLNIYEKMILFFTLVTSSVAQEKKLELIRFHVKQEVTQVQNIVQHAKIVVDAKHQQYYRNLGVAGTK
jgi:hypothetical protein